LDVNGAIVVAW